MTRRRRWIYLVALLIVALGATYLLTLHSPTVRELNAAAARLPLAKTQAHERGFVMTWEEWERLNPEPVGNDLIETYALPVPKDDSAGAILGLTEDELDVYLDAMWSQRAVRVEPALRVADCTRMSESPFQLQDALSGTSFDALLEVAKASEILLAGALAAARQGDHAKMEEYLSASLNLAAVVGKRPTVTRLLIATLLWEIVVDASVLVLDRHGTSEPCVESLYSALCSRDFAPSIIGIAHCEMLSTLDAVGYFRGLSRAERTAALYQYYGPPREIHSHRLLAPFDDWRREREASVVYSNDRCLDAFSTRVIESFLTLEAALSAASTPRERDDAYVQWVADQGKDKRASGVLRPLIGIRDPIFRTAFETLACLRLLRLRASLTDPQSAGLDGIDPFTEDPFLSRAVNGGTIVYSVGRDYSDDGGAHPLDGTILNRGADIAIFMPSQETGQD